MRWLLIVLVACGGSKRPTEPIGNATKTDAPMGGARVVSRTPTGGVIELAGERDTAMDDAVKQMEAHCGKDQFTIIQAGEEAVGDTPETTRVDTVWRVHYLCSTSH